MRAVDYLVFQILLIVARAYTSPVFPAVSVIIPVYNRVEHLQESIMSILDQTMQDLELIIIDDGSTNQELKLILTQIQETDKRVIVYELPQNKGPGHARNYALGRARG